MWWLSAPAVFIACLADAIRIVSVFVSEYNEVRLHSALGYVTPMDMLVGRQQAIFDARDAKLELARQQRALARQQQRMKRTADTTEQKIEPANSLPQTTAILKLTGRRIRLCGDAT